MTWHVKVTMDGVATCDEGGQILRFRPGSDKGPLVLISKAWPGVTVEDVTPPRTWTDGDVIVSSTSPHVFVRREGRWRRSDGKASPKGYPDATAERTLAERPGVVTVLRYQAGA